MLTLHVDDGMVFGDKASPEYKQLKAELNKWFKITHRKSSESGAKPS